MGGTVGTLPVVEDHPAIAFVGQISYPVPWCMRSHGVEHNRGGVSYDDHHQ